MMQILLSLVALVVVIAIITDAANDNKVGITTIVGFQWVSEWLSLRWIPTKK